MTAETGDPVRFSCEIESVPEAEITWEKDGAPIESAVTEDNYVNGSRFVMLKSGVLHIYQVESGDAGIYRYSTPFIYFLLQLMSLSPFCRCVARNELADKDRKSQAGRLIVTPKSEMVEPQFVSPPPSDLWVVQGGNATIECLVTAGSVVQWTLNSTQLPLTPPGYLSLTNVESKVAGDYACVARTAANLTVTRITTVRVATLPEFIRVPKSQVFPTAKTVRFECEVTGTPSPDIRWLKVTNNSSFFK